MGDTTTTLSCASLEIGGYHGLVAGGTDVFPTQGAIDFSRGQLKMACVQPDDRFGGITSVDNTNITAGSQYTVAVHVDVELEYAPGVVGVGAGAVATVSVGGGQSGAITAFDQGSIVGGSGYTTLVHTGIALVYSGAAGGGTGAVATVTVDGTGVVTAVAITAGGSAYAASDVLTGTLPAAGATTPWSIDVATAPTTGGVTNVVVTSAGLGYTNGEEVTGVLPFEQGPPGPWKIPITATTPRLVHQVIAIDSTTNRLYRQEAGEGGGGSGDNVTTPQPNAVTWQGAQHFLGDVTIAAAACDFTGASADSVNFTTGFNVAKDSADEIKADGADGNIKLGDPTVASDVNSVILKGGPSTNQGNVVVQDGNITVTGTTPDNGNVIAATLLSTGDLDVGGAGQIDGALQVDGAFACATTATISGNASCSAELAVTGLSNLIGGATITAQTTCGALTSWGNMTSQLPFTAVNTAAFGGAVTVNNTLGVTGATSFQNGTQNLFTEGGTCTLKSTSAATPAYLVVGSDTAGTPSGSGRIHSHPPVEEVGFTGKLCFWRPIGSDGQRELMCTTSAPHEEIFKEVADAVGTPPYSMLEVDSVGRTFKRDAFHSGNLQRINHDHHNSGNNTHGGTNAYQGTVSFPNLTAGSMLELNANKEVVSTSGFSSANLARINADHSVSADWTFSGDTTFSGGVVASDEVQVSGTTIANGAFYKSKGDAPSSAGDTGSEGEMRWDESGQSHYLYVCVASDTWMRTELSSWQ
jgi:hypothetical protein